MWILGLKGLKTIDDPVLYSRGRGKMTQIQIMNGIRKGCSKRTQQNTNTPTFTQILQRMARFLTKNV